MPTQRITVTVKPQPVTKDLLESLDQLGLIMLFKPTDLTSHPPPEENVGDPVYVSDPVYGPHKLIAVGVNKTQVRLGVHKDNEDFLIPNHDSSVKPLYLLICHLPEEEIRRRDQEGTVNAGDFTCLSLYPAPRGTEMFTMPKGTVHCELTSAGPAPVGTFFVTESNDLDVDWIDLEGTEITVGE